MCIPIGYPGKTAKVKLLLQVSFSWGFYQTRDTLLDAISRFTISVSLVSSPTKF